MDRDILYILSEKQIKDVEELTSYKYVEDDRTFKLESGIKLINGEMVKSYNTLVVNVYEKTISHYNYNNEPIGIPFHWLKKISETLEWNVKQLNSALCIHGKDYKLCEYRNTSCKIKNQITTNLEAIEKIRKLPKLKKGYFYKVSNIGTIWIAAENSNPDRALYCAGVFTNFHAFINEMYDEPAALYGKYFDDSFYINDEIVGDE